MLLTRYGVAAAAVAFSFAIVLPPAESLADGNVTVVVDSRDNLIITGDGANNDITITDTETSGVYEATGNNGTTVNGSGDPHITDITDRDIVVEMGGGDDTFTMSSIGVSVRVTKNLKLTDSGGNDIVVLDDLFVGKRVKMDLGDGDNDLTITDSQIVKNAKISTGIGMDVVLIEGGAFRGGIDTDDGDDMISVISSGQGKNTLKIKSGDDNDTIEVTDVNYSRKVAVNGGRDNDTVTIGMIVVGGKGTINGSTDEDTLIDNGGHSGVILPTNFEVFP